MGIEPTRRGEPDPGGWACPVGEKIGAVRHPKWSSCCIRECFAFKRRRTRRSHAAVQFFARHPPVNVDEAHDGQPPPPLYRNWVRRCLTRVRTVVAGTMLRICLTRHTKVAGVGANGCFSVLDRLISSTRDTRSQWFVGDLLARRAERRQNSIASHQPRQRASVLSPKPIDSHSGRCSMMTKRLHRGLLRRQRPGMAGAAQAPPPFDKEDGRLTWSWRSPCGGAGGPASVNDQSHVEQRPFALTNGHHFFGPVRQERYVIAIDREACGSSRLLPWCDR